MNPLFKSYSDEKIVEMIKKGGRSEENAVAYVLKRNEAPVYSYILKNSGNKQFASEILVEGVTELIFNIRRGSFRGESKLNTYLFAICRSIWLKTLKKNKRSADWDDRFDQDLVSDEGNLNDSKELKTDLSALLQGIGEACKKVLEMWSSGHSMTEIAEYLDYKNSQIAMNKKNRCLTKLKDQVKGNDGLKNRLLNYMS